MLAAVIDTEIVWNIAYVSVALVAIPNLIALFWQLRKECILYQMNLINLDKVDALCLLIKLMKNFRLDPPWQRYPPKI